MSWILLYLVQSGAPFSPLCPDHPTARTGHPLTLSEVLQCSIMALPLGAGCGGGSSAQRCPARQMPETKDGTCCEAHTGRVPGVPTPPRHLGGDRPRSASLSRPLAAPQLSLSRPSASPQPPLSGFPGRAGPLRLPRAALAGSASVSGGDGARLHR